MDYPKHLEEKIRQEVAVNYLKHEFKKIFPSVKGKDVEKLISCKELAIPRDFWNGVHGISMGFKLKIGLVYLITAENIKWTKEKIAIDELWMGVELGQTKNVRPGKISTVELINYYQQSPKQKVEDLKVVEEIRSGTIPREDDPIMVMEKIEDQRPVLSIYDGNGRVGLAILKNKKIIDAYVGRYTTDEKKPKNYWLPTSVLMDILFYLYKAIDDKNDKLFNSYIEVLRNMVTFSKSGKYEFLNRALTGDKEKRDKILKVFGPV